MKTTKGDIAKIILATIAVTGIVLVSAAAPNIFKMIPKSFLKRHSKKSVDQSVERLKRRGLVKTVAGPNGWRVELTEKGRNELAAFEARDKILQRPKKWDKKWRLLIFDIDEKRKTTRDGVRRTLAGLGFYRLQDSVWAYPYECEDILELLRTKHKVRHDALYIRAEKIGHDRWLKSYFKLS